ncbi:MAG: ribonuclease III [Flavobacteriaceae bacterium]|nr:ribonuclease III [Flavobacteriaceae bacterium]
MGLLKNIFESRSKKDGILFEKVSQILGFKPKNIAIYQKAFTHRSAQLKDQFGNDINYERLEFLGDSVLGAVISCYLFDQVPNADEGYLTKMRSKIVSRQNLNQLGKELQLSSLLKSNNHSDSLGKNIDGNLFESLIGAIYLDKGFKSCENFIFNKVIEPYVDIKRLEGKVISYKSLIIEWCQKNKHDFRYEIIEEDGVENLPYFAVRFYINNEVIAKARETSKKKAEEKASRRAYYALQNQF